MYIYDAIQKIADKIRLQNPDIVGRPTYTNVDEKVTFHFNSLDGKTELTALAEQLTLELSNDRTLLESNIKVIRDDKSPLAYGPGVIVISLVK